MRNYLIGAALAAAMSGGALAQPVATIQPAPVAVAPPIQAPATTNAVLRVGTPVPLRLLEELTTKGKKLRVGQRFRMETSAPASSTPWRP